MSATVSNVYVQAYADNVRHLSQQGVTRLRPWVQEVHKAAEAYNFERIAATAASEKTTRKTPTPDDETAWSRRKVIPKVYHTGDVTEHSDIGQMLVDPNSNYARAQGMAMARAFDDEIIAAATGASRDGAGNSVAYNAAQTVGTGVEALTFDLIAATSRKFMENDIDPETEKVFVISPKKAEELLKLEEAKNGDYNALQPLTTKGYVDGFMGYKWIVSTRLLAPAGGQIDCFAMTRDALGLQVNYDVFAEVAKDPSISFAWRIYCEAMFGAVRVEDEQLVRVHLAEA